MEIKDFIKEALLQIVDGVSTANEALQDKGAFIPTKGLIGEGKLNIVPLLSKVGLGVNANGAASRETKDDGQTIHRIRCTIPLSLPDSPNE